MLKKFFQKADKDGITTDDDILSRKKVVLVLGIGFLIAAVIGVSYYSFVQKQKKAFARNQVQRPDALLTEKDKRSDWMSSMESEQDQVKKQNQKLTETVTDLTQTVTELRDYIARVEENRGVSEDKVKEILQNNYNQQKTAEEKAPEKEPLTVAEKTVKKAAELANIADIDLLPPPPKSDGKDYDSLYANNASRKNTANSSANTKGGKGKVEEETPQIYEYEPEPLSADEMADELESFNIPSGSFVKGVLLVGVDAPTMQAGESNPLPVFINLNEDVVLPNRYRSDLIDCIAIGSARGDISSERVYIRLVSMSCVETATKKRVVDTSVTGWIFGEDGKAGLRGRLVSKQGALLAKVLLAGFAKGVANAFNNASSEISTTAEGSVSTIDPNKTLEVAGYSGIGNAASKLAEFYMDMAEAMFPIIEIGAGRTVTMAFKDGKDYQLEEKSIKERPLAGE